MGATKIKDIALKACDDATTDGTYQFELPRQYSCYQVHSFEVGNLACAMSQN
jgi:hypothetical protein